jgi:hypothetical protein
MQDLRDVHAQHDDDDDDGPREPSTKKLFSFFVVVVVFFFEKREIPLKVNLSLYILPSPPSYYTSRNCNEYNRLGINSIILYYRKSQVL